MTKKINRIDLNLLKYINKNTFYTNILLIPIIVLFGIITNKLYIFNNINTDNSAYKLFFLFCFIILFFGTIISTIYHYTMYNNNNTLFKIILKNIGLLDRYLTAPLIFLIFTILVINYFIYYSKKDTEKQLEQQKQQNIELLIIFILGVIYSIIGLIFYIYKSKYKFLSIDFITNSVNFERINDTILHTIFHFTTYVGLLLILFVYYINFDDISEWFEQNNELVNIYFILSIFIICLVISIKIFKYLNI